LKIPNLEPVIEDVPKWLQRFLVTWRLVRRVVNGGLEFGSPTTGLVNMRGAWATGTTPSGGAEFAVTHNLGYIPTGFLVWSLGGSATIYSSVGGTPWNKSQIFLKCAGGSVTYTLFIS